MTLTDWLIERDVLNKSCSMDAETNVASHAQSGVFVVKMTSNVSKPHFSALRMIQVFSVKRSIYLTTTVFYWFDITTIVLPGILHEILVTLPMHVPGCM